MTTAIANPKNESLLAFVERYASERAISSGARRNLLSTARTFGLYLRRPAQLADLNRETVNAFLADTASVREPSTVKGHRNRLLTLWRAAYDQALVDAYPTRIRPARVPRGNPDSWDKAEVLRLVQATLAMQGTFKRSRVQGVSRAAYLTSLVLVLYETGMRLGDLFGLTWQNFRGNHVGWVQHKTGKPMIRLLSDDAMALLRATFPPDRDKLFGGVINYPRLRKYFARTVASAGLQGTLRKLRRTSGNQVELEHPGAGHQHLGNTPQVFQSHYADSIRLGMLAPSPSPLGLRQYLAAAAAEGGAQ